MAKPKKRSGLSVIAEGVELVPVSELQPHPQNPRQGDVGAICESIKANGFYAPLIVQRSTNRILAGNHRWIAARELGLEKVPVAWVDVDDDRALRILLVDNRDNDLASYANDKLAELLQNIQVDTGTLEGTGYDDAALDELLAELGEAAAAGPVEGEDDAPETPAAPVTVLGDLWLLGGHRVLCGDSTLIDAVERLCGAGNVPDLAFTDPPYGISVVKGAKVGGGGTLKFGKVAGKNWVDSKTYAEIRNDDSTQTAREFYQTCIAAGIENFIIWGGNYFTDFLPPSPCWVIWDKQNTGNFADVEMAWTSFDKGAKLYPWLWNGLSRAGDRKTELESRVHPTQKPVGLFEKIFTDFQFSACFDGFLGSGSTLIACEKTRRVCYGMELAPEYVDVIVRRWQDFTGKQATLDGDGRTFDEVAAERQCVAA